MVSSTLNGLGTRGIRDRFNSGLVLGTLPGKGKGIPIQRLTLAQIATALANNGALPLPSQISSAALDAVFGSTEGNILQRGASVWQVLAPGTNGQVLTSQGAAALNHWAAVAGGTTLSNAGAWNGTAGYTPGQGVQWLSSSYLNYVAVAAATGTGQQWTGDITLQTISTTNTTNDTATSQGGNGYCDTSGGGGPGQSSGKWYFEFVVSNNSDNNTGAGIAIASRTSRCFCTALGPIATNFTGGGAGNTPGVANNKRGAVAIDATAKLIWFTPDVTAVPINWNSQTVNSPDSGLSGLTITTSAMPVVYPYYEVQNSASVKCVLYTTAAAFSIPAIPPGFSAWVGSAVPNLSPDLDTAHWQGQGNQNPANLNEHALLGGV